MKPHYVTKLNNGDCWRRFSKCPYGKAFLQQLYSWSEDNPLHPFLVMDVCDKCDVYLHNKKYTEQDIVKVTP